MAALSEADMRKILGDKYKEEGLTQETAEQRARRLKKEWNDKLESYDRNKFSALAIFVVGVILLVSNFYAVSGPSVQYVEFGALAAMILGAIWYYFGFRGMKRLEANPPSDAA